MTENLRLFKGVTELNYSSFTLVKSNDHIVNTAKAEIEGNANVTNSSVLDFKASDGSTKRFTAKINQITKDRLWELELFSNGYELNNLYVEQVYVNRSPEYIVEDIITNHTQNLTYASSTSSGVTIPKMVVQGYAIDIIKELMETLRWQIKIDVNDNFYFEPEGFENNGVTLTHGSNGFAITKWNEDKTQLLNSVRAIGGFSNKATEETIVGTGTEFTLTNKPSGVVRITVSGTEQDPSTFTVDAEEKKVTFTSSKTDPTFFYAYDRPLVMNYQDDASIAAHEEVFQEITVPSISSYSDLRRYARNIVGLYKDPLVKGVGVKVGYDFSLEVGETINVVDNVRNLSTTAVITKLEYTLGRTRIFFGPRDFELIDWQRGIEERQKKLERQFLNTQDVVFARSFESDLSISLTVTETWEFNSPENSLILSHKSLGNLRDSRNVEADCSSNSNHGTWQGTGIGGSQYNSSGHRLFCGAFNGTDNYVEGTGSPFSSDPTTATIAIYANFTDFTQDMSLYSRAFGDTLYPRLYYDQSDDELVFQYELDGVVKAITVTSFSSSYNAGTWYSIIATLDNSTGGVLYIDNSSVGTNTDTGTNFDSSTNAIRVGHDANLTSYMKGKLDEFFIWESVLTSAERANVISKIFQGNNLKLYYSFDDPVLGDQSTSRSTVT